MEIHMAEHPLERIGHLILRYGLVIILISVGALKFTAYETEGIQPLVTNSPLLAWANAAFGAAGFAMVLGIIEIVVGLMIASRAFAPRVSAYGSMAAVGVFLITLSLLLTTPGVWQPGYGFPFPSPMPGQFLLKDLLLLGAAVWSAGEALRAAMAGSRALRPTMEPAPVRGG